LIFNHADKVKIYIHEKIEETFLVNRLVNNACLVSLFSRLFFVSSAIILHLGNKGNLCTSYLPKPCSNGHLHRENHIHGASSVLIHNKRALCASLLITYATSKLLTPYPIGEVDRVTKVNNSDRI